MKSVNCECVNGVNGYPVVICVVHENKKIVRTTLTDDPINKV